MAAGDLKGTLAGGSTAIVGGSSSATGSVVVEVGDLLVAVVSEGVSNTVTGVTDSLGHTYTAQNAGTLATNVAGRAFYIVATTAGTLTAVSAAMTTSTHDWAISAAAFAGPVGSIDANPANATDATSPLTCPSSGTLALPQELVIAWSILNLGQTDTLATSPNLLAVNACSTTDNTASSCSAALGYQVVSSTSAIAPAFTASGTLQNGALGLMSFKLLALDAQFAIAGALVAALPPLGATVAAGFGAAAAIASGVTHTPTVTPTRTNYVRNNTNQGAGAGSPGTMATNWGILNPFSGLTRTITLVTSAEGYPVFRVRFTGVPSSGTQGSLFFETSSGIPGVAGGDYTVSCQIAFGGTLTNISLIRQCISWYSPGPTPISTSAGSDISGVIGSAPVRQQLHAVAPANTAFIRPGIIVNWVDNVTSVDFTLDFAVEQLEHSTFASDPILTSGSAVTVGPDLLFSTAAGFSADAIGPFQFAGTAFPAVGSLSASVSERAAAAASFVASGALSTATVTQSRVIALLAATAGFTADEIGPFQFLGVPFPGVSALSASAQMSGAVAATFGGSAGFAIALIERALVAATMAVSGGFIAGVLPQQFVGASFASTGALLALGSVRAVIGALLSGTVGFSTTGSLLDRAAAQFAAASAMSADTLPQQFLSTEFAGSVELDVASVAFAQVLADFLVIATLDAVAASYYKTAVDVAALTGFSVDALPQQFVAASFPVLTTLDAGVVEVANIAADFRASSAMHAAVVFPGTRLEVPFGVDVLFQAAEALRAAAGARFDASAAVSTSTRLRGLLRAQIGAEAVFSADTNRFSPAAVAMRALGALDAGGTLLLPTQAQFQALGALDTRLVMTAMLAAADFAAIVGLGTAALASESVLAEFVARVALSSRADLLNRADFAAITSLVANLKWLLEPVPRTVFVSGAPRVITPEHGDRVVIVPRPNRTT